MSERIYTTRDKSEWGPGPWQDEPDKVQWKDAATGLDCLANRGPGGHWCGYVGVPPGHPAHGLDYDKVYNLFPVLRSYRLPEAAYPSWEEDGYLEVHGGLTYASACADGPEETSICHVPEPGEPEHVWWLGFDCAHEGDISPQHEAYSRKRAEEDIAKGGTRWPWLPVPAPWGETYRTLDYVRRETTALARQLASLTAEAKA